MTETLIKDLAVGDRATVVGFAKGAPGYRRKLLSMGLAPPALNSGSRASRRWATRSRSACAVSA